jgi:hypothetical protein
MIGGIPPPFLGSLPYLQKIWMGVYRGRMTFENTRPFSWEVELVWIWVLKIFWNF